MYLSSPLLSTRCRTIFGLEQEWHEGFEETVGATFGPWRVSSTTPPSFATLGTFLSLHSCQLVDLGSHEIVSIWLSSFSLFRSCCPTRSLLSLLFFLISLIFITVLLVFALPTITSTTFSHLCSFNNILGNPFEDVEDSLSRER